MPLHLFERHFAPGLPEEILESVGLELGTPVATRRRDMAFRAAVLEAYLAECHPRMLHATDPTLLHA